MDFNKISNILSQINTDSLQLENADYLPADFWIDLEDGLYLADFVSGGWATPTKDGEAQLELAWRMLCDIREIDPKIMYDTTADFFRVQTI